MVSMKQPIKSLSHPCQVDADLPVGSMRTVPSSKSQVTDLLQSCMSGTSIPVMFLLYGQSLLWPYGAGSKTAQVLEISNLALLRRLWGISHSKKPTAPRMAFFLAYAQLLADSMTGECSNFHKEMESTGNAADTDVINKKQTSKETRGIEELSQEDNLVLFSQGWGNNTTLHLSVGRNIHVPFFFSLFPSSEGSHGIEVTRRDSTPQEKTQRHGQEKESSSLH